MSCETLTNLLPRVGFQTDTPCGAQSQWKYEVYLLSLASQLARRNRLPLQRRQRGERAMAMGHIRDLDRRHPPAFQRRQHRRRGRDQSHRVPGCRPAARWNPSPRSTAGTSSALIANRPASPAGSTVAPRRVAQASSAATRSATSRRSSTGPASNQPATAANPGGQSGGGGRETSPGAGSCRHREPMLQCPKPGPHGSRARPSAGPA